MKIQGVGIGRGVAVGPAIHMAPGLDVPGDEPRSADRSAEAEFERVQSALSSVKEDLLSRAQGSQSGKGAKEAAPILTALAQMAEDPALSTRIRSLIDEGKTAERSVYEGFADFEDRLKAIGGYMGERANDLHDVGQRVIANLLGVPAPGLPESDTPFVLVAPDLSPADTSSLDMNKVLAIVTIEGGPTSHTAILARSRGIVAVVGAQGADAIKDGQTVIVKAASGQVVVDPSKDEIAEAKESHKAAQRARALRGHPGQLKDGYKIPLLANVGKPADAEPALDYGAEGVGLFRSEFLFLGNKEAPGVDEQARAYKSLLEHFPGRKVVIRLLDAGADKPLPFLSQADEPNPALGLRGLRALKVHRQVLDDQLEALALADSQTDADLWVMAPMVADEHETEYFVKLGKSKGLKRMGVMAEVPSIALMADKVAKVADFVSIGTNDLTQYTLAADRTLGSVATYQTAWHPAVLRAIKLIADAGQSNHMPVGVCGEAAADPDLAVVLAGIGVTSLSMTPAALDDVRVELTRHTREEARNLAARALDGEFYHPQGW